MKRSRFKWIRLALVLVLGLLALSPLGRIQPAKAYDPAAVGIACRTGPTFALEAKSGYIQMPDMNTMFMWSYAPAGGDFQHPGPILCVNQGDTVTVTLTNSLPNYRSVP